MGRKDVNESIGGSWNQEGRLSGIDKEVDKAITNKQRVYQHRLSGYAL